MEVRYVRVTMHRPDSPDRGAVHPLGRKLHGFEFFIPTETAIKRIPSWVSSHEDLQIYRKVLENSALAVGWEVESVEFLCGPEGQRLYDGIAAAREQMEQTCCDPEKIVHLG